MSTSAIPALTGDENVISIGGIAASGTQCRISAASTGQSVTVWAPPSLIIDTDGHLGTSLVNAEMVKKMKNTQSQGR